MVLKTIVINQKANSALLKTTKTIVRFYQTGCSFCWYQQSIEALVEVENPSALAEGEFKSRGFEVIKNVDEKTGLNDNARPIVETKLMTTITAKEQRI